MYQKQKKLKITMKIKKGEEEIEKLRDTRNVIDGREIHQEKSERIRG
jgi:hypothetical protein